MFQYKLVNRIVATNKYLKIINLKDNDACTFFKTETLIHLFWQCEKVQSFITDINTEILKQYEINLDINSRTCFFQLM